MKEKSNPQDQIDQATLRALKHRGSGNWGNTLQELEQKRRQMKRLHVPIGNPLLKAVVLAIKIWKVNRPE